MTSPAFGSLSQDFLTGTSFTATEPSGAADGNGFVLFVVIDDAHSGVNGPTGWTSVGSSDLGPATTYIYSVRRGSSAPSLDVSWTTSRYSEWLLMRVTGQRAGNDFVEAITFGTPAAGVDINPPSVTTLTADTLIVAGGQSAVGTVVNTAPTNYTLRSLGDGSFDYVVATREIAAIGAEDPGVFDCTQASSTVCGFTLSIASDAGGGGGGDVATVDHSSVLSFPALCRRPQNDNGRWTRGQGGLWVPRRAA